MLLGVGLLAVVVWIAFLLYTALKTANPVIVSRPQVLAAPIVVEGQWQGAGEGLIVERVWRGEAALLGKQLAVEDFELAQGAGSADRLIVPLEPVGDDRFRVAPTRRIQKISTKATPTRPSEEQVSVVDVEQVYPATAPVIRQFEELFGQPIETAKKN